MLHGKNDFAENINFVEPSK